MSNEMSGKFTIGSILKMIRATLGLKQKSFCKVINLSQNCASLVENSKATLSRTTLREIEEILGMAPGCMEFLIFNPDALDEPKLSAKIRKCQEETLGLILVRMKEKNLERHDAISLS